MKQKDRRTVPSRPAEKLTPTVPSRPIQETNVSIFYRLVPFRLFFFFRQTCQNSAVPPRPEYYQP